MVSSYTHGSIIGIHVLYLCKVGGFWEVCAGVSLENPHQWSVQLLSGGEVGCGHRALHDVVRLWVRVQENLRR